MQNVPINPPLAGTRSFCELVMRCEIRALAVRIGTAVVDFFSYIAVKMYEGLAAFCEAFNRLITCSCVDEEESEIRISQPEEEPVAIRTIQAPVIPVAPFRAAGIAAADPVDPFPGIFYPLPMNELLRALLQHHQYPAFGYDHFAQPEEERAGVDYEHLKKDAPVIPSATVEEKKPTEAVARQRRAEALKRLEQIKTAGDRFACSDSIRLFDLDKALHKYKTDQAPTRFLEWHDYAMPDRSRRDAFQKILTHLRLEHAKVYPAVRSLLSKVHYILAEKKARVDRLPRDQKPNAENALKQQVRYVISRLLDANTNCIDQTLSQLEGIATEVVLTENPLDTNNAVALLQYKAAFFLFKYRANKINEILLADPALRREEDALHMADIEREVKKNIAGAMGIKAEIIDVGAYYKGLVSEQVRKATERVGQIFFEEYKPVNYLQDECRVISGSTRELRNELLQWAQTYYNLDGEDELSKAVVADQEALDNLLNIGAVDLTLPGIQLFLEAAGIIQKTEGQEQ